MYRGLETDASRTAGRFPDQIGDNLWPRGYTVRDPSPVGYDEYYLEKKQSYHSNAHNDFRIENEFDTRTTRSHCCFYVFDSLRRSESCTCRKH